MVRGWRARLPPVLNDELLRHTQWQWSARMAYFPTLRMTQCAAACARWYVSATRAASEAGCHAQHVVMELRRGISRHTFTQRALRNAYAGMYTYMQRAWHASRRPGCSTMRSR
jgi:hypothetical protein